VRTREHVDLWLHGLALLMPDSTRPPLYRRAYADSLRARRTRDRVLSAFDAQQDKLRARLSANPRLGPAAYRTGARCRLLNVRSGVHHAHGVNPSSTASRAGSGITGLPASERHPFRW